MHATGRMGKRRGGRGGFALPVAVFALVIVGVLVTGGFYMARQETRIGVASQNASDAFYLAETGIYQTLAGWKNSKMSAIGTWNVGTFTGTGTNGTWSVAVTPMTSRLYLLEGTGTVTKGGALWAGATRKVGMLARVYGPDMEPLAALSTQGKLTVGGSTEIEGGDTDPEKWSGLCGTGPGDKPGIMIDDTTNISYSGSDYAISGNPKVKQDTTLTPESLLDFGDVTWAEMVSLAGAQQYEGTVTLTSIKPDSNMTASGAYECVETTKNNWGSPNSPNGVCGTFFPIIYAKQSLRINATGSGQGILLVEGDLEVQGGFTFYGPVVVRGELRTAGTGGHFNGGVIAANVQLEASTVLGDAQVIFSSCAVERALLNNNALARARPLARRSWVDISNIP